MRSRDRDRIGEVELALAVVVADPLEDGRARVAGERHQAAVAEVDRALAGLASSSSRMATSSPPVEHQAAVAGRIVRPKAEHHDGCAFGQRRRACAQRLRPDQRRVAEDDQDIVGAARDRRFRRQHRMRGAAPLVLHEDLRFGRIAPRLRRHRSRVRARPRPPHAVPPASRTASSTCASSDRPATACSTFGRDERMRVPSPAASTTARQLRSPVNQVLQDPSGAGCPRFRSSHRAVISDAVAAEKTRIRTQIPAGRRPLRCRSCAPICPRTARALA